MVTPASYTNTTFADYLKDEVLMDTALELGWLDINTDLDGLMQFDVRAIESASAVYDGASTINRLYGDRYVILTATGSGTVTRGIQASLYDIPTGTVMTFTNADEWSEGANAYTTAAPVVKGATSITFTATNGLASGKYGRFYNVPVRGTINPIYQQIIDSTLMLLGETAITDITDYQDVHKLRLFGRREAWKYAMQTLASDYDYSTSNGGGSNRSQVYQQCTAMYEFENNKILDSYGGAYEVRVPQNNYVESFNSRIRVRW